MLCIFHSVFSLRSLMREKRADVSFPAFLSNCIYPTQSNSSPQKEKVLCLSNRCSAVNGCHQNESVIKTQYSTPLQFIWVCFFIRIVEMCLCISEWVPSEWESMDGLQWIGDVRMRVNGCAAVNGCRQNESHWMLCSEWVPSEWESIDACSEWVPSEWESMDAVQWMGAIRMRVNGCAAVNGCRQNIIHNNSSSVKNCPGLNQERNLQSSKQL